ncbi:hypothetical protein ACWN83_00675 [Pseudolactococcus plantarum]|nr:hypothetical protein [Lactococcus plantarum]
MNYIELAIKSGGFMEMDSVFLKNRLALLPSHEAKLAFIMPPASVVNAYFSEIYQKQGADAACDYFLTLSTHFDGFSSAPSFALEGSEQCPTLRIIRLNLLGKSFGFVFEDPSGHALVFSELADEVITNQILFEIAQLFPQYVVIAQENKIQLRQLEFAPFTNPVDMSALSTKSENDAYIQIKTLNTEDGLAHYEELSQDCVTSEKMLQFKEREFIFYIRK